MDSKVHLLLPLITVGILTYIILAKRPEVCELPIEKGTGLAYRVKYAYNPTRKRCEPFVYGGCGGNENNFTSLIECKEVCVYQNYSGIKGLGSTINNNTIAFSIFYTIMIIVLQEHFHTFS